MRECKAPGLESGRSAMSADASSFCDSLGQAAEESLDDLAHFRPNRHAAPQCGFLGPAEEEKPAVVRRFPEEGCPPFCSDCHGPFHLGEIFHPEMDGTRCIPCFKVHYRRQTTGLAAVFRAASKDAPPMSRALDILATTMKAAAAPPTPDEIEAANAHPGLRLLGKQIRGETPAEEDVREYVQWLSERYGPMQDLDAPELVIGAVGVAEAVFEPTAPGPSPLETMMEEWEREHAAYLAAHAVGKCARCGRLTANPDQIGGQCRQLAGVECPGFIRNLDGTFERR